MHDQPTTIVLRFRDLITSPGGTIENHNRIAGPNGHVWWGWWNKSGETIPDAVFRELNQISTSGQGLRVLLFDSGRDLLFETNCKSVVWDNNHARIPSPEKAMTPEYYSGQRYFAWFKFSIINQISQTKDELNKLTYVRVDEFFEQKPSKYSSFYGKRVYDADELRQQDRTIWFVRPFNQNADHTHEVRLLDAQQIAPTHFKPDFARSQSRHLLWISDLHFSLDNHHSFPLESTPATKDLGQAIEDSAKSHEIFDFAGVLISGDITWKADAAEFEQAVNFCRRIARSPSTLDNYRFAVCPGNHDLAFSDEPANKMAAVNDKVVPEVARAGFSKFYSEFFYLSPNSYLSSGRRYLLGDAVPVEVICLNSSLIEQKQGWFQGHGFVGQDQLDHAEEQFGWGSTANSAPRPIRIVVIHHHLMPVHYREIPVGGMPYSVALDAEAITQWVVKHRVDLVLHGHMHKEFYAKVSRPCGSNSENTSSWHTFYVLGLGSSGVGQHHRKGPNMMGILSFEKEFVNVSFVTVDPVDPSRKICSLKFSSRGEHV